MLWEWGEEKDGRGGEDGDDEAGDDDDNLEDEDENEEDDDDEDDSNTTSAFAAAHGINVDTTVTIDNPDYHQLVTTLRANPSFAIMRTLAREHGADLVLREICRLSDREYPRDCKAFRVGYMLQCPTLYTTLHTQ